MTTASWPRIPATTLADQVYRAVRTRILDGQMAPGEFIREKDLNEAMGVSRTPIREALGRLASEGFLERIPHKGFRVPEEPLGNLLELYPLVASLELLAGRLALPKLNARDISRLKRINEQLSEASSRRDAGTLIELNTQFHHVFCERSGNRRLCDLLHDLRTQLDRLEIWYYSDGKHTQQSVAEHDEIISAIERGEYDRALSILESNMSLTYKSLLEETQPEEDW